MSIRVIGSLAALVVLTGCSTAGSKMPAAIANMMETPDYTDKVCESPMFKAMIGTFNGDLTHSSGAQSCLWSTTLSVVGQSNGDRCDMTGYIEATLIGQGSLEGGASYICESGKRETIYSNGLRASDDITTIRPVSIGVEYPPMLPETDSAGNKLVHSITQYEHLTVEYEGLVGANGTLFKQ